MFFFLFCARCARELIFERVKNLAIVAEASSLPSPGEEEEKNEEEEADNVQLFSTSSSYQHRFAGKFIAQKNPDIFKFQEHPVATLTHLLATVPSSEQQFGGPALGGGGGGGGGLWRSRWPGSRFQGKRRTQKFH